MRAGGVIIARLALGRAFAVGGRSSVSVGRSPTRRFAAGAAAETDAMSLEAFCASADASWTRCLNEDPEGAENAPNKVSRAVRSGHFVRVAPSPLPRPSLALASDELAAELGLDGAALSDPRFARYFGGELGALPLAGGESWATPYALSIMGERQTRNCPFGTGEGYGDGRAVSVGEVVVKGRRFELQLKGGGTTPFCRGADGRAVLRSSLREFLASEAMHFLGVPTTRALSLVVSGDETSQRPWYSRGASAPPEISEDDPRLAQFPPQLSQQLIRQLQQQAGGGGDPDVMVTEACAITTRVAPSFTRVGHLDLFARRARTSDEAAREHALIVQHAIAREYPDLLAPGGGDATALGPVPAAELRTAALRFAERSRDALADLAAGWLRVGFCQGNFNADNCLVGGRTMDYGPFGFIDKYDPKFAKWVGSGDHFSFAAQPGAALANFKTLATSLAPLFDDPSPLNDILAGARAVFVDAAAECYRQKLGFGERAKKEAAKSWKDLEPLLRDYDYTIFFRSLAAVDAAPDGDDLFALVAGARYGGGGDEGAMKRWLADWKAAGDGGRNAALAAANPKYVLREWMLVDAYDAAAGGDFGPARELHGLVKSPYDEHPDLAAKYYVTAPRGALTKPGTAFMT